MSKPRTPRRATTSAASTRTRPSKKVQNARVHCAMPACELPRISGKAFCSSHARQARERLRVAAGEAAWA
ncbi:MAG: hypothetical protein WEC34_08650 [Acidimicrobiia bacterium]|jgi:hypothetical protein